MRLSDAYKEQNRQLHENPQYGTSGAKWAGPVSELYVLHDCNSVLDYGCGKQTLSETLPHLMIKGYDPCMDGLDAPPNKADLVVCGDVMEHVEEGCVDDVLDHIHDLAGKVVFFVISTQPARKLLSDGRNAHITIKQGNWWLHRIMVRWQVNSYQMKGGGTGKEIVCVAVPKVDHETA